MPKRKLFHIERNFEEILNIIESCDSSIPGYFCLVSGGAGAGARWSTPAMTSLVRERFMSQQKP